MRVRAKFYNRSDESDVDDIVILVIWRQNFDLGDIFWKLGSTIIKKVVKMAQIVTNI